MKITKSIMQKVNSYLGYELITEEDLGFEIGNMCEGDGRIEIAYDKEDGRAVDNEGNIVKYHETFKERLGHIPKEKAMFLIAALFPEELRDTTFLERNKSKIKKFVKKLGTKPSVKFHWSDHFVRFY